MNFAAEALEKVWILDEEKLYPILVKALEERKAVIHDGVAYWASGSGKTGVIQHIPFKESAVKSAEEAIKAAQMTTVMATAASTCIILGALIIQTKYLAEKLNKIQAVVDEISQDIHSQNIIFYMDKITEYVGGIEVARTLLADRNLAEEIKEISYPLLSNVAAKRNHALSFIDNVLNLARNTNQLSDRHFELVMDFAHMMMEIMPLGIHTEYLLTSRIGKPRLAEHILIDGSKRYNSALSVYKNFMNEQHRALVRGDIGSKADIYHRVEDKAIELFSSKEKDLLLSLPLGRMELLAA